MDPAGRKATMISKGTPGYAFTILVVAGLAFAVLLGALLAISALMGH